MMKDLSGTPGVMFVAWQGVARARGYIVQWAKADTDERIWSTPDNSTDRKKTYTGMEIGQAYAFRVAAIFSGSLQSEWSMEVVRTAA